MNTTEMLKEICGVNETGKTKSGVTLDLSLWSVDDDEIETIKLFTLYKPIIQVVRNHVIQIDFNLFNIIPHFEQLKVRLFVRRICRAKIDGLRKRRK